MYNRKTSNVNSDLPSEDRGYDRSHRQTQGGYEAYDRGEQPMTYWSKHTIVKGILCTMRTMAEGKGEDIRAIARTLRYANVDMQEVREVLCKLTKKELVDSFLVFTGTHYTGNYYRYTKFYGISEKKITKFMLNHWKPPVTVQLKLF